MPEMPQRPAGTADRAAGVGADGQRRHARRHAAAEPPLEPPGTRDRSHGLCVGKKAEFSFDPPMANSSMFVRPISTASAAFSLATTVAS